MAPEAPIRARLMPPHAIFRDFLPEQEAQALLDWAVAHESDFAPTTVGVGKQTKVDANARRSVGVRHFGPVKAVIRERALALGAELISSVKMSPVVIEHAELELVAHGDGAHYMRHIDTAAPFDGGDGLVRVLSAVYYVFRRPKAFTGGELRLYAFGYKSGDDLWLDVEPENNALVVFPSWAPHAVRPVACRSGRFRDFRFAVNVWLCTRAKTTALAVSNAPNAEGL